MAYDQRSYQSSRQQVAPQQPRHQYQQDYNYGNQQHHRQTNYAAEEYGTFDPYAQDAGNPYSSNGGGAQVIDANGYGGAQSHGYTQAYSNQTEQGYRQQEQGHTGYGQATAYAQDYGHRQAQQEPQPYGNTVRQQKPQSYGNTGRQQESRSYGNAPRAQDTQPYGYGGRQQDSTYAQQKSRREGYSQHDQQFSHDAGYAHGYGQNGYSQGHAQQSGPAQSAVQGYGQRDGYSQRPQTATSQGYGASNGPVQSQEDRRYDPRYQQRPGQNQPVKSLVNNTYNGQTPVQSQSVKSSVDNTYIGQTPGQSQSVKSPVNNTFNGQRSDQRQAAMPPSRSPGNLQSSHSAPSLPAEQPGPKKLTMQEWKAQEKARMHKDASKPETLAQDNAFPTFPTKKAEPARGGNQSAMSSRKSEEHTRPSTASSLRPDGRPGLVRNHSSQPDITDSARPSLDYKSHALDSSRPSIDSQHRSERIGSPLQRMETPPQQAVRPARTDSYGTTHTSPGRSNNGAVQSIDTTTTQTMPPPLEQISSNARPSTSDSNRYGRRPSEQPMSPLGKFAQSAQDPPSKPAYQHHPQQSTLSEVYNGYYDKRDTVASSKSSLSHTQMTRDEEIEAEMPDFDSAAPSQAVLKQRRQTIDQHLGQPTVEAPPPPVPAMPAKHGSHSSSNFDFGFSQQQQGYGQRQYQPQHAMNPPVQPYANETYERRSMDDARRGQQTMVNGRPPPQQALNPPVQPYANGSHERRSMDDARSGQQTIVNGRPSPQQALDRPVQPYANETYERRSMDDARRGQQTLVNGRPPPQRFYDNLTAPRPEFDRQGTAYSDPGMQRVGNVPPVRPGTQQSMQSADARINLAPIRPGTQQSMQSVDARSMPPPTRPGTQQSMQSVDARSMPPPTRPGTQQSMQSVDTRNNPPPVSPDALPAHPTPVRAGLIAGAAAPVADRPLPVRNYGNAPAPGPAPPAPRAPSGQAAKTPITHAELQQLRAQAEANPQSMKTALSYAKALVEASKVLASDGGRADPKIAAKNRERYIMDAYKRVKKLVSAGYPDAQFYLADCYGQGSLGLEVDSKEAFKLYQAAAKSGHATAAYRTAVCCEIGADEGGGTSRDYPRAVQWYRRAAALGETAAMFKVGMISLKGLLGQPRNLGEATTWLKRAAERADEENPHALHELAVLYETANSTPELRQKVIPDDAYALSMYKQAAELGAKHSQFRLGQAYEYGQLGLQIDHRASIAWYSKAAAKGEHQAELALSGWYLTGAPGILEHSDTEAYLWARKAAQAEPPLAKAMFAMGYFLETGIGCAPNIEEAKRWYGRAASYKHPKALERLEAIKRGVKGGYKAMPATKKITRKDQKHDESECTVM